jgi:mannose-6-phosphate isomerase-like protein (cupin superfamily)
MTDKSILFSLTSNNKIFDKIASRLDSLKILFKDDPEEIKPQPFGFTLDDSIVAATVYQTDDVTVTKGIWLHANVDWPLHCHVDSAEYLIVTAGSFLVNINGVEKILAKGECQVVPLGVKHSVRSLEDNSKMLGICIPPEIAYLAEDPTCLILQREIT